MTADGLHEWQPPPLSAEVPSSGPDLRDDEFMEIEACLGRAKEVIRPGDVIRLRMDWITFGGLKFRAEDPVWLKIKIV